MNDDLLVISTTENRAITVVPRQTKYVAVMFGHHNPGFDNRPSQYLVDPPQQNSSVVSAGGKEVSAPVRKFDRVYASIMPCDDVVSEMNNGGVNLYLLVRLLEDVKFLK